MRRASRSWPRGARRPPMSETPPADLVWGAFSEHPPWVIDRAEIAWLPDIDRLRAVADGEVPLLTAPTTLPPGARVARVAARLSTALVPWLVRKRRHRYPTPEASRTDLSRRLRLAAESLGSTYIKLGQIISSGEGLFPAELVEEFKLCRDQVKAETFAVGARGGRGRPRRHARGHVRPFDRTPLAAASIAQVTRRRCTPASRSSSRCSGRRSPRSCARTCGSWRGWRRTSSGGSRSPRWPTRRRWSSCSPRRSSRSSTSASKRPTCSTSRRCSCELGQSGLRRPPSAPVAGHPASARRAGGEPRRRRLHRAAERAGGAVRIPQRLLRRERCRGADARARRGMGFAPHHAQALSRPHHLAHLGAGDRGSAPGAWLRSGRRRIDPCRRQPEDGDGQQHPRADRPDDGAIFAAVLRGAGASPRSRAIRPRSTPNRSTTRRSARWRSG